MTIYCRSIVHVILQFEIDRQSVDHQLDRGCLRNECCRKHRRRYRNQHYQHQLDLRCLQWDKWSQASPTPSLSPPVWSSFVTLGQLSHTDHTWNIYWSHMEFPIGICLSGVSIKWTCVADVNNTISSLENIALSITHTIFVSLITSGIMRTIITRWTVWLLVGIPLNFVFTLRWGVPSQILSSFPGPTIHYGLLHPQNPSIFAPG